MVRLGAQLAGILEGGIFPLPMGGIQYADRKTLLCDVVREYGTRRKLTKYCENSIRPPSRMFTRLW